MSSQKTTNYDLNQWLPDDSVLRTDFNADNAKIDAALQALADTAAGKADAGDLSALENTVAGQAAQLAKAGNIQLNITTYTGTGTYGSASPNTLSFSTPPFLVVITGGQENAWGVMALKTGIMFRGGHLFVPQVNGGVCWSTTWAADGNSVSWYEVSSDAAGQFNASGVTYTVYVFTKTK